MTPSKELLSKVLNKNIIKIEMKKDKLIYIKIKKGAIDTKSINLYKLEYKCKEWLKFKKYMIQITHHLDTVSVSLMKNSSQIYSSPAMTVYTELEAMFIACEWIIQHTKQTKD